MPVTINKKVFENLTDLYDNYVETYNGGQTAIPEKSSSVSYTPTLVTGTKVTYSISPALTSGLSFNTSTGNISGTTPSTSNDTVYIITATNSSGTAYTSSRYIDQAYNTAFLMMRWTSSNVFSSGQTYTILLE